MKIILADDDLRLAGQDFFHLIAPFSDGFNGRLHRLRAAVHGQNGVGSGPFADFLIKGAQLIAMERPGDQGQFFRLLLES